MPVDRSLTSNVSAGTTVVRDRRTHLAGFTALNRNTSGVTVIFSDSAHSAVTGTKRLFTVLYPGAKEFILPYKLTFTQGLRAVVKATSGVTLDLHLVT